MYIINVHIANQSHWASKIEATWNSIARSPIRFRWAEHFMYLRWAEGWSGSVTWLVAVVPQNAQHCHNARAKSARGMVLAPRKIVAFSTPKK